MAVPPVTTSQIDWLTLCRQHDRDFDRERQRPVIYRFSGVPTEREFRAQLPWPYTGPGTVGFDWDDGTDWDDGAQWYE